jgi:glycosyltransferase involved in cell wall biosynthesis
VLYLITNDLSSLFLRGQLSYLHEYGFHVELGARLESIDAHAKLDDGVVLHDLPYTREPSPFADLKALLATVRLIRSVRPDIVNASTPKAGLLGSIAAWLCRVPRRIYVVRGLRYETATGKRRALFKATEKLAIRLATDVIFNSKSLRKVAEDGGLIAPGRGIVLGNGGNGLDTTRFENLPSREDARATFGFSESNYVIGFVGRLTKDKGIADLLEVFDLVLAERPEARLLIVGSYEPGDPVGGAARARVERDERIVHVEWMANPGPSYKAMDVLCFPSYREGLPNVPIEAQYCGVPVVGYAATGTVDSVVGTHGNRVVEIGDVSAMALAALAVVGAQQDGLVRDAIVSRFSRPVVLGELAELLDRSVRPGGTHVRLFARRSWRLGRTRRIER